VTPIKLKSLANPTTSGNADDPLGHLPTGNASSFGIYTLPLFSFASIFHFNF